MAVETDADRAIFFDPDEFGVTATVTPSAGAPFDVEGIYDGPHMNRGVRQSNQYDGNASEASGQTPTFKGRMSDMLAVKAERAVIAIPPCAGLPEGGTFRVRDVKPDGTGLTVMRLMRA